MIPSRIDSIYSYSFLHMTTLLEGTYNSTTTFSALTSEQQKFLKNKWEAHQTRRKRDPELVVQERRDVINLYMEQYKGKAMWKGDPKRGGRIKIISSDADLAKKIFSVVAKPHKK